MLHGLILFAAVRPSFYSFKATHATDATNAVYSTQEYRHRFYNCV